MREIVWKVYRGSLASLGQISECIASFLEISEITGNLYSNVESNMKDPGNLKYAEV